MAGETVREIEMSINKPLSFEDDEEEVEAAEVKPGTDKPAAAANAAMSVEENAEYMSPKGRPAMPNDARLANNGLLKASGFIPAIPRFMPNC